MSELILPSSDDFFLPTAESRTHISVTDRDIHEIKDLHKLRTRDFAGKTILDLGCGVSSLSQDLERRDIGATVISIDIDHVALGRARQDSPYNVRQVRARLEALPIKSGSIDLALATFSLPYWASSPEQIDDFLRESRRVLRVGGVLSISPNTVAFLGPFRDEGYLWMDMREKLTDAVEEQCNLPGYKGYVDEDECIFTLRRQA